MLEISDLVVDIRSGRSTVRAVDGISLTLDPGRTLGLVGESGCGKSTTGLAVLGLLPAGGKVTRGSIRIDGHEIVGLREAEARAIRGRTVGVVFQDPMTALNPTQRIGAQVAEPLLIHGMANRSAAMKQAVDLLGEVGLSRPAAQAERFPHELSGGMRQRVMIALALICGPKLLVADEPTTALDVTTQDQILQLFDSLQQSRDMSILLITHDMGVVAGHTDEVAVMYAGRLAELATTHRLFGGYRHRYTEALLESIPTLDTPRGQRLATIAGLPPNLGGQLAPCRFAPRCAHAEQVCFDVEPQWSEQGEHGYACHLPRRTDADLMTESAGAPS
ncbi:MAG: peptide/nickel transport system ATP-binding protein ddpF [Pseudonocardiales bacterium]|jgi:oligopeptide/dipeptide ABC transporter ATP-binding protein|nr:peptide/nickel transport system ATP-binding protein ddpF [Pseudonocardiales bacterium]